MAILGICVGLVWPKGITAATLDDCQRPCQCNPPPGSCYDDRAGVGCTASCNFESCTDNWECDGPTAYQPCSICGGENPTPTPVSGGGGGTCDSGCDSWTCKGAGDPNMECIPNSGACGEGGFACRPSGLDCSGCAGGGGGGGGGGGNPCGAQYSSCAFDSCCSPYICKAGRCDVACSYDPPDKPDLTSPGDNSTVSSPVDSVDLRWSFTNGWGNSCTGADEKFKVYTRLSPNGNWSTPAIVLPASPTPFDSCPLTVGLLSAVSPLAITDLSLNWGGLQEKWFVDKNNSDYYIYPLASRAKVYKWQGGLQAGGGSPQGDKLITKVETLDCYNAIPKGSPTTYSWSFSGSAGQKYDWRVRADNGSAGINSDTWSFTISGTQPLEAWWQAQGGDVTAVADINSAVPSGQYLITAPDSNPPGVAVAGGTLTTNNQPASSIGWKVANTPLSSQLASTYNYTYLKNRIKAVVDPVTISNSISSAAQLTSSPPASDGVYYVTSPDATVTANINLGNAKIVWLVEGNLNINGAIDFAAQGLVVIIASGNITIDPDVTALKGIYIAGGTVNTGTGNIALQIDGSVVGLVNVNLQRQKVAATPAETFVFHPEMIVNLPSTLRRQNLLWQEVAP